ncbi:hypothetical protein ACFFX0_18700 [Citricoccus parietis]|uniref:Uncharacterized protein n=1 Tax=Citricoccus parietis TaxID=592307 RepID=A0ABV5G2G4_9MICC
MQVAVRRMTASVGSMILGSWRSPTVIWPGASMMTARMAFSFGWGSGVRFQTTMHDGGPGGSAERGTAGTPVSSRQGHDPRSDR